MEIRTALPGDLPAIVALLAEDKLGQAREAVGPPLPLSYQAGFDAIAADPNQILAVAEIEGQVIGTLQITFLPGLSHQGAWRGQIESVRIAAALRGQGLGGQLFAWAIARCRARGCRLVQLTTNKSRAEAHRFYGQLGFTASHEGFKLELDI